jgi:hypothetical protein
VFGRLDSNFFGEINKMINSTFLKKALMAATGATVVSFAGGQAAEAVSFDFTGGHKTEELVTSY